jgi:hypothetical protein
MTIAARQNVSRSARAMTVHQYHRWKQNEYSKSHAENDASQHADDTNRKHVVAHCARELETTKP